VLAAGLSFDVRISARTTADCSSHICSFASGRDDLEGFSGGEEDGDDQFGLAGGYGLAPSSACIACS
jgi:hypothetical protein